MTKNFASTSCFGKNTNTQTDTYWDYYLNNTWYNSISSSYKSMLVDETYYLGSYVGAGNNLNYKITVCKDSSSILDSITIKNCTKYTSNDADKTFTGKVGLLRIGEMFSSQIKNESSMDTIWTITPSRAINTSGNLNGIWGATSYSYAVRPSITLKSGIKITGGTGYVGGETNSPFEISE